MELKKLYKRLIDKGYWPIQIYQLIFLYKYYIEKGTPELFESFMNQIDESYDAEVLEQIIKCITHNTPYDLFIKNTYIGPEKMNEIRRYLEDTLEGRDVESDTDKRYYALAKRMITGRWYNSFIYQFRRFVKCEKKMAIDDLEKLFNYIEGHDILQWVIIDCIYEVYMACNKEDYYNFINSEKLNELIKAHYKDDCSEEGDYVLLEIQEYAYEYRKEHTQCLKN